MEQEAHLTVRGEVAISRASSTAPLRKTGISDIFSGEEICPATQARFTGGGGDGLDLGHHLSAKQVALMESLESTVN